MSLKEAHKLRTSDPGKTVTPGLYGTIFTSSSK